MNKSLVAILASQKPLSILPYSQWLRVVDDRERACDLALQEPDLVCGTSPGSAYNVYNVDILTRHPMSQPPSETVTVRLPTALKQKLEALAVSTRRSKSWLAAEAIAAYVEQQTWQIQQIEEAVVLADSDQADWVDGDAVNAWLESWGTADEQSPPCA